MQASNEKNKLLILGCSFTQGSYTVDPKDKLREIIESNYGWYDKLDFFKDKKVDIYASGGCGLTTYASILNKLDRDGILNQYDTVIIQETSEPRLSLFNKNHTWMINKPSEIYNLRFLNITHYSTFANFPHVVFCVHPYALDWIFKNYELEETNDKYKLDLLSSPTLDDLVDHSKTHIKFLLEKHKIKTYVFGLFGYHLTDTFFHRLPLSPNLYDFIMNYSITCLSSPEPNTKHLSKHFSKYGNEVLGNMVNSALKEKNTDKLDFLNIE